MVHALDPYHRIRATVAAVFLLTVLVLAVTTGPGARHTASPAPAAVTGAAPAPPAGAAAQAAARSR